MVTPITPAEPSYNNWAQDPAYEEGIEKGFSSLGNQIKQSHDEAERQERDLYASKGQDAPPKGPSPF